MATVTRTRTSALDQWAADVRKEMPERVRTLMRLASFDLYFGPFSEEIEGEPYPGFTSALEEIEAALPEVSEMWADEDCGYVIDSEPEAWLDEETGEWIEPYWESIRKYSRREVLTAIVGCKELASMLS